MTTTDSAPEISSRDGGRRALAAAAPLAVVAVAAGLWLISDWLGHVGPLDRGTFGWAVVVPLWAAAPLVAGMAWRRLSSRTRQLATVACGFVVGMPVAILLWEAAAFPACVPARQPPEWILPAIMLGGVVGGGFGLNNLVASAQVRAGHPWRGLVLGAVGQLGVIGLASILAFVLFFGLCQRP